MKHYLKTDPAVFAALLEGAKTYELRKNDRAYQNGDILILKETVHTGAEMAAGAWLSYTGRQTVRLVTHVLHGPIYGLAEGWVILSVVPLTGAQRLDHFLLLEELYPDPLTLSRKAAHTTATLSDADHRDLVSIGDLFAARLGKLAADFIARMPKKHEAITTSYLQDLCSIFNTRYRESLPAARARHNS